MPAEDCPYAEMGQACGYRCTLCNLSHECIYCGVKKCQTISSDDNSFPRILFPQDDTINPGVLNINYVNEDFFEANDEDWRLNSPRHGSAIHPERLVREGKEDIAETESSQVNDAEDEAGLRLPTKSVSMPRSVVHIREDSPPEADTEDENEIASQAESDLLAGHACVLCDEADEVEDMVGCEADTGWFHLSCVGKSFSLSSLCSIRVIRGPANGFGSSSTLTRGLQPTCSPERGSLTSQIVLGLSKFPFGEWYCPFCVGNRAQYAEKQATSPRSSSANQIHPRTQFGERETQTVTMSSKKRKSISKGTLLSEPASNKKLPSSSQSNPVSQNLLSSQNALKKENWKDNEKSYVITLMQEIVNEGEATEKKWSIISERLMSRYSVDRSAGSVKNWWNRHGRAQSNIDERKKPKPDKLQTGATPPEKRRKARKSSKCKSDDDNADAASPPIESQKSTIIQSSKVTNASSEIDGTGEESPSEKDRNKSRPSHPSSAVARPSDPHKRKMPFHDADIRHRNIEDDLDDGSHHLKRQCSHQTLGKYFRIGLSHVLQRCPTCKTATAHGRLQDMQNPSSFCKVPMLTVRFRQVSGVTEYQSSRWTRRSALVRFWTSRSVKLLYLADEPHLRSILSSTQRSTSSSLIFASFHLPARLRQLWKSFNLNQHSLIIYESSIPIQLLRLWIWIWT